MPPQTTSKLSTPYLVRVNVMFINIAFNRAEQFAADGKRRFIEHHKRHVNVVVDKEALNRRSSHLQSLVFRVTVDSACDNTTELSPCVCLMSLCPSHSGQA